MQVFLKPVPYAVKNRHHTEFIQLGGIFPEWRQKAPEKYSGGTVENYKVVHGGGEQFHRRRIRLLPGPLMPE